MKGFLQHEFDDLWKRAADPTASEAQKTDCRWFFFAGALAAFEIWPIVALAAGEAVTGGDMTAAKDLQAELDAFKDEVAMAAKTVGGMQ